MAFPTRKFYDLIAVILSREYESDQDLVFFLKCISLYLDNNPHLRKQILRQLKKMVVRCVTTHSLLHITSVSGMNAKLLDFNDEAQNADTNVVARSGSDLRAIAPEHEENAVRTDFWEKILSTLFSHPSTATQCLHHDL